MAQKIRVLYIDDSPHDKALVRDSLEKVHGGFELTEAKNQVEFENLIESKPFDLVLTDFNILGYEGMQVLEYVNSSFPHIPVIIVTGTGSEEIAVEAMKKGASDYVIKSTNHIKRLPSTIISVLEVKKTKIENEKIGLELIESEERFRSLMEQAPFAITIYDEDGLQISANKAYEEMWKFPISTSVGKFNIFKSKAVISEGLIHYVKRAYAGESVSIPEYFFDPTGQTEADGKGRVRWLSTKLYPIKDQSNVVRNIVLVHQDITERKRSEQIQKLLYDIANAVATTANLENLIKFIREGLKEIIDTTNFYIALYNKETDTLSLPFFSDERDHFDELPAGKTLNQICDRHPKIIIGKY